MMRKTQAPRKINQKPRDFSQRAYYPGTEDHPFHKLNLLQDIVSKLPGWVYPFLVGAVLLGITRNITKSLIFSGFMLLDWVLLSLLPRCRISFGPPNLTTVFLGLLRAPLIVIPLPAFLIFHSLGTGLVFIGFYIEPQTPRTSHMKITLSKPEGCPVERLRIVHLSDLHMEFFTNRERRIIDRVNSLEPDLILFTGDFFNLSYQNNARTWQDIIRFFNALFAGEGIFGVTGSPAVDLPRSISQIKQEMKLTLLQNQSHTLKFNNLTMRLVGLSCTHQPGKDRRRLDALHWESAADVQILLYHSPDLAPALADTPFDLHLAGHTHGGQVRLPLLGPIFTSSLYGLVFNAGHYIVNEHTHLIISRGIGLEGNAAPRVRFLAPPEIGMITLEFSQDNVK